MKTQKEKDLNKNMTTEEVNCVAARKSLCLDSPTHSEMHSQYGSLSREPNSTPHLVTVGELLVDLDAPERIAKRPVSVFVLEKLT